MQIKINPATLGVLKLHVRTLCPFFHLLQVSLCLFLLGRGSCITQMEETTLRAAEGKADVSHLALRYLKRPDFCRRDTSTAQLTRSHQCSL